MRRMLNILGLPAATVLLFGCGQEVRTDSTNGKDLPVVNPLAPGAREGVKSRSGATSSRVIQAPPGMKTGIPK